METELETEAKTPTGNTGAEALVPYSTACRHCRGGVQAVWTCAHCDLMGKLGGQPPTPCTAYQLTRPELRKGPTAVRPQRLPPPETRLPTFPCGHSTLEAYFLPPLAWETPCPHCAGTGKHTQMLPPAEAARRKARDKQKKQDIVKRIASHLGVWRVECEARTRKGTPCRSQVVPGRTRCKLHGGLSTGPRRHRGAVDTEHEDTEHEALEGHDARGD